MDYVNATNLNKINSFKEKYRKYDVFIMDDIQFINGKERTQDELFHLFNSLYEMNKQIIFSSDKHPNLLLGLEDRMRSRFNQGMIVDVNIPSFESRLSNTSSKNKGYQKKSSRGLGILRKQFKEIFES
jgi:chromosomal replication initiator protein